MTNPEPVHPPVAVPPAPAATLELLDAWPDRRHELALRLQHYLVCLLEQNRKFNLTGERDPVRQWSAHVDDALHVARLVQGSLGRPPAGRLADVGSGGGVPGLVFALLWPELHVALIEATGKKARFLEAAASRLELGNIRVLNARAEILGLDPRHRESYDFASARALAALPVLAEWTLPLLRTGGRLLAIKGPDVEEEIAAARNAFSTLGARPVPEIIPYRRADDRLSHLLIFTKAAPTPPAYPRPAGVARRRPLS
jgi:16S rRNA (guanine527-N7)-methyltransferase